MFGNWDEYNLLYRAFFNKWQEFQLMPLSSLSLMEVVNAEMQEQLSGKFIG